MPSRPRSLGVVGFLGLLAIEFIGLKLAGLVSWPWTWVLAPVWVPVAIGLVVTAVFFAFAGFIQWRLNR